MTYTAAVTDKVLTMRPARSVMVSQCTNCGGALAVKAWCVECAETLCQECVEAHKRVKLTRSHTILNQHPDLARRDLRRDSAASPRFCPIHQQEVLKLYCFTCEQLTCRDCQIMNHPNHSFQFVHEAYKSIRKQMYHVLQPVDKHTEMAKQSIQDLSSRIQDIHSQTDEFKISIHKHIQLFKQRISQQYAQVMVVYRTEEENLQKIMEGLLEKVEDYRLRLKKVDEDTTDIKTLLALKTEMESWSKWILSQDVRPPKFMTKVKLTFDPAPLAFGELQVSYVPFACNKVNSPEVLSRTAPKQSDTAGATAPPPASSCLTTFTNSPHLPYKPLPQTRNPSDPGPSEHSVSQSSVLGSARSNQPSFPPGQSNVRNEAPTIQSSPSSGFPQIHQQTNHQQYSQQQTSNVGSSRQKTSNLGYSQSSQSNIGQAATTQSPPTCNYQQYSYVVSSHPVNNSSRSMVVYNTRPIQPLPPNKTAEHAQRRVQTSIAPVHPASQSSYSLGIYPTGTNFYPVIGSSDITKQNQGTKVMGPNGNIVVVGVPIMSTKPTLVLGQNQASSSPVDCTQQAISGQLPTASTNTTHPRLVTLFHQNTTASSLNHTTPKALPCTAAEYSSSYSSGTSHDAVSNTRRLTHNQIYTANSVPSPPTTPSNQLQSPPACAPSISATANNPLLLGMILKSHSSTGDTSDALTSDPEHTQPGTDRESEPKEAPPTPQGQPPTTKAVKALADSACDISSCQGLGELSLAPNIQENELTSTVSDTRPSDTIPSVISELLSLWEDGGEILDSEDVTKPTASGMQETTPASPASLLCEVIPSETSPFHQGAGGTEATEVRSDRTNASSESAGCSNKKLMFWKAVAATSAHVRSLSGMLKNMEHGTTPLKRIRSTQKLTNLRTGPNCRKKKRGTNRQKKQPKDSESLGWTPKDSESLGLTPKDSESSEKELFNPEASEENPASPESPEEDPVSPEPLGDEPSKDDIGEAGSGTPLMGDPCIFSPVVSLVRLPLSAIVPGRPLPCFVIHAGETGQELYLEEIEDDVSHDDDPDDYLRPLSDPESPDDDEVVCACCCVPTCDVTCSQCERSFHSDCHVPPGVLNGPNWVCSVCQDLSDPRDPYTSVRTYTPCLSLLHQRKSEQLLLCLLCLLSESCSTTNDPAEALGGVRDRLCHRQSPPYRTFLELISDLQVALVPPENGAPSIWEGVQLSALVGDEGHCSLQLDPSSQGTDEPPASPTHRPSQQQTMGGPQVRMEPTGSEEEEEEKAGPSSRWSPTDRLKVKGKMKETRKRLKAFLNAKSAPPKKKRRSRRQPDKKD